MAKTEFLKITDSKGFTYEVLLDYSPNYGFTTAYYNGSIVGQVELGRILQPMGDDDREWEMYEQQFSEWTDEIKHNMVYICKNYFDNQFK